MKIHKWKNQICLSAGALHKADVTWGDVKAENVLIDERDDAWVVDFGGGYTEGWVEKETAGTLAGDAEGLINILEFIGDWNLVLETHWWLTGTEIECIETKNQTSSPLIVKT